MPRDFELQLNRQLGFLARSCDLFDEGYRNEAIRIAVSLRVLFHDTQSSTSLIKHLNKPELQLLSTIEPDPHPTMNFQTNLTYIAFNPYAQMHESIPRGHPPYAVHAVPFAQWWKEEIVYVFLDKTRRVELTRKKLVNVAANQDGGAHVDRNLDHEYSLLEQGAGASIEFSPDGAPSVTVTLANAHLSALRQIGREVLESQDILSLQGPYQANEQAKPVDLQGSKIISWGKDVKVWDFGDSSKVTQP